jgi:hypothetical protein
VAKSASTPQTVTLAAPTRIGAPPMYAAMAPSDNRHTSDTAATTTTSALGAASGIHPRPLTGACDEARHAGDQHVLLRRFCSSHDQARG